jgi:hypothetical protein
MSKLLALLAGSLGLFAGSAPAIAQQASPKQATPQQVRRFVANFQSGVSKGCLGNPPREVSNPASYCSCYAKSFIDRYSPNDLAAISNLAASNPQSAYTINLMMKPEARTCAVAQPPSVL